MKHWVLFVGLATILTGCASSGGPQNAGQSVGSALRAPVDFVSGFGSGISGSKLQPTRPFDQNWDSGKSNPVFWEEDAAFFSSL